MVTLKLGPLSDDKPVKVTMETDILLQTKATSYAFIVIVQIGYSRSFPAKKGTIILTSTRGCAAANRGSDRRADR